jgi:hypothetical protein
MVEDDPLAGLINLFDLWMVFSIALLLSLAAFAKPPPSDAASSSAVRTARQAESIFGRLQKLPRYRVSREEMSGQGVRLGTAYRLGSGEVVYVPEE